VIVVLVPAASGSTTPTRPLDIEHLVDTRFGLQPLVIVPVGVIVATRRPENRMGRLLVGLRLTVALANTVAGHVRVVYNPRANQLLGIGGDLSGWRGTSALVPCWPRAGRERPPWRSS